MLAIEIAIVAIFRDECFFYLFHSWGLFIPIILSFVPLPRISKIMNGVLIVYWILGSIFLLILINSPGYEGADQMIPDAFGYALAYLMGLIIYFVLGLIWLGLYFKFRDKKDTQHEREKRLLNHRMERYNKLEKT